MLCAANRLMIKGDGFSKCGSNPSTSIDLEEQGSARVCVPRKDNHTKLKIFALPDVRLFPRSFKQTLEVAHDGHPMAA